MIWSRLGLAAIALLTIGAAPAREPVPDCTAHVGYDRDADLPGFLLPTRAGPRTCIPFTTVAAKPPVDAKNFYVTEFSDAHLRQRWAECARDDSCRARVLKQVEARRPPNRERAMADPRARFLLDKVDEPATGLLDLTTIRRPGYFARAPYLEPIAALDRTTHVVEFTAPPDTYDRLHQGLTAPVRLRGWYLRGTGAKPRGLVIMTGGGGTRVAAIDDPADALYRIDTAGKAVIADYPNATTGSPGQRRWRQLAATLARAGFDVLLYDRRGAGMSGGFTDTNTLQQGRDILAMVASLRDGTGLRATDANGVTLSGAAAVRALRPAGSAAPVLLLGNSRGSMATGWAMTMNFAQDCSYDLPTIACGPPRRDTSIKGAMLVAEFVSGVGYVSANTTPEDEAKGLGRDRGLFIAASEMEKNIVFFPSSAILAGIDRWPAAFFARGLWDYASSLEGTMDSYSRVRGPRELMVVRGPHPFETWPQVEVDRLGERVVAFATAVTSGQRRVPNTRPWHDIKSLVATSSDAWERSTRPTVR